MEIWIGVDRVVVFRSHPDWHRRGGLAGSKMNVRRKRRIIDAGDCGAVLRLNDDVGAVVPDTDETAGQGVVSGAAFGDAARAAGEGDDGEQLSLLVQRDGQPDRTVKPAERECRVPGDLVVVRSEGAVEIRRSLRRADEQSNEAIDRSAERSGVRLVVVEVLEAAGRVLNDMEVRGRAGCLGGREGG